MSTEPFGCVIEASGTGNGVRMLLEQARESVETLDADKRYELKIEITEQEEE